MRNMKKVFKKAIITIIMASFISVQISGAQAFARGNGHNHDHGHEHIHEENEYEDLENTTTDVTIDETENEEDITSNNDEVVEENGPEDELLEEESTEGEVPTEDNEESTGEDNETPEFELPEVEIDESEEEPDVEGSEEIEEEIIDDENDTDISEDEEVENENVSDSDIITLHPSVEEQLANLSQEQIDSYIEFAAKRTVFFIESIVNSEYSWLLDSDNTLIKDYFGTEEDVIYCSNVTDKYIWSNIVFYVIDSSEIHMMSYDGSNDKVIYRTQGDILEVTGTGEFLFVVEDDSIYRLHISSGIYEFVTFAEGANWLLPYDNQSVRYVLPGELVYDEDEEYYYSADIICFFDIEVNEVTPVPHDFDRVFNKESYLSGNTEIYENYCNAGVMLLSETESEKYPEREDNAPDDEIPFEGYGIESGTTYFSKTGKKCTCHSSCNPDVVCDCLYFDGGTQCGGYAAYAYYLYNHHKKTQSEKKIYSGGVHYTADDWKTIKPGSFIRLNFESTDKLNRHAIFIYSVDENGVTCYEANYSKTEPCIIKSYYRTFEEMESMYYKVGYYFHPDNAHSCEYSSSYSSNSTQHWLACIESTCTGKSGVENHTESDWYINGNYHSKKCTVCGYVTQSVAHTQGNTYSIDGTNHWLSCTVCGVKMTSGSHNSSNVANNGNTHSYSCSFCGKLMSTASHTYGNYVSDASNHWKVCTVSGCGAITGKAEHTAGSLVNNGNTHSKSCTTCGYVTLSASHSYTSSYSKYSSSQHKATCACGAYQYITHTMTLSGVSASGHTQICSKCGYSVTGGHAFTISKNDTNTHKKVCSFCGYSTTVNHTYVANGYNQYVHFYKCSVCGQSKGVAHEYTSTVTKVSTASTCTKTVKKCSCGYSTTVTDTSHRFTGIRCLDCNYWRG